MENTQDQEKVANVQEAEVVKADVVDPVQTGILAQKKNFLAQLETVRKNMSKLQQDFEAQKTLGIRLEGALESLEMLLKSTASK